MSNEVDTAHRALQILRFIEYKYVSILEEVLAEEAEILSKPNKTIIDEIKLIGLRAIKKHIADELGIPYLPQESSEEESILELTSSISNEVEVEA